MSIQRDEPATPATPTTGQEPTFETGLIENLPAYLSVHGYRVVRAEWRNGDPCPWLIVASDQDPASLPICQRSRAEEEQLWARAFSERGVPDPEAKS
jgi:hypothetical protein